MLLLLINNPSTGNIHSLFKKGYILCFSRWKQDDL